MPKKKVAIIGAGVVGASAAYFLSKEKQLDVTLFDEGTGQGTSASAGIISPWLSRRRNKEWYRMVKAGAAFYPPFLKEVMNGADIPTSVYRKVGTLLFKHKPAYLEEMLTIGKKRREHAPEIGELSILSPEEIRQKIPYYTGTQSAVWASGGARVDGSELVSLLVEKAQENGATFIQEEAFLAKKEKSYLVSSPTHQETVDSVILAAAAWLPDLLHPLGYTVDVRPQKGQLVELRLEGIHTDTWPVIMPEGEKDIIPFDEGHIIIGATHEDEAGFNLTIEKEKLQPMIKTAAKVFSAQLAQAKIVEYRSGTRAYTSDYAPFFGEVPASENLFAASGLGATGLTAGPLVGKALSELVLKKEPSLAVKDYPIENYVQMAKD